jgi:hypothetical protein
MLFYSGYYRTHPTFGCKREVVVNVRGAVVTRVLKRKRFWPSNLAVERALKAYHGGSWWRGIGPAAKKLTVTNMRAAIVMALKTDKVRKQ